MKTKNKLLTVLCAVVFTVILSAFVCLAGSADNEHDDVNSNAPMASLDDGSLDVMARTISVKENENVHIKYAVPEGEAEDVKMLFWTEEQTDYVIGTQAAEAEPAYKQNVDGVDCSIFKYEGMEDKQMTDVIYSRAYTVVDGVYHYGEVNKYSILQYAYNKKNAEEPDEKLNETLDELLEKGADAQKAESYKLDDLANEPHSIIHAVDGHHSDGFADSLHPDSKEVSGIDKYLKYSGDKIFYIEFNIAIVGYVNVESYIYYFEDGVGAKRDIEYDNHIFDKKGRVVADNEFVTINTEVYYFVSQKIVYNYYAVADQIYYFGNDGAMRKDHSVDNYYFGHDGAMVADNIFFESGDNVYYIQDNIIIYIYIYIDGVLYLDHGGEKYPTADFDRTVFASDNDYDIENNDKLGGVKCTAYSEELDMTFVFHSDAEGHFNFKNLPKVNFVFIFEIEGYISATVDIDVAQMNPVDNIILDKNVSNNISGKVYIADSDTNFSNNASLSGAIVEIERVSSTNPFTASTTTDANGNYSFGNLTAGVYVLVVRIETYIIVNQTVYVRENETNIQNTPIEMIPDGDMTPGMASGNIVDARTGRAVSGVTVYIRAGLNNTTGEVVAKVYTNSSGVYSLEGLVPGNYTAQVVDERSLDDETYRFGTLTIAIKVMANVTITNQNATVSNSAGLDIDGMRVVLTWGSSPSDLDSHMNINLTNGNSTHIYYSNKTGLSTALDVDDTTAYGPETITVSSIGDGTYTYYIYNYSRNSSTGLSNSGATINIYFGASTSPEYTLYVPQGSGYYWNVFTYNSVTGEFTITNTIR